MPIPLLQAPPGGQLARTGRVTLAVDSSKSYRARRTSRRSGAERVRRVGSTSSERGGQLVVRGDAPRRAAQAGRDGREIERIEPRPCAGGSMRTGELVHDGVAPVAHDDEDDARAVARRAPERLDRVRRRAVAEQREHGPAGQRHAQADGAGEAEAERAVGHCDEAERRTRRDAGEDLGPVRRRLLDEDRIGGQARPRAPR